MPKPLFKRRSLCYNRTNIPFEGGEDMADRVIFHCDLNCFFASVELLDKPALREVPVAVCGDPASRHGIILAKNEPAKQCGVKTAETMREAMQKCKAADSIIAAHCEDMSWIPAGGAIHDSAFAKAHGIPGIPSESEWKPIERDIALCRETDCRYHVCHVSTKESVALIRQAKAEGINITCETGPHYLLLCQDDLQDLGRFKMNPPLRTENDRQQIIAGLADGTIDLIATDHAPHSTEEKSKPITEAPSGIIGLETSLALGITNLVKPGYLTMIQLLEKMTVNPAKLYHLPYGTIQEGADADFVIFDPDETWIPKEYASKSSNSPFTGEELTGKVKYTICGGNIVYSDIK